MRKSEHVDDQVDELVQLAASINIDVIGVHVQNMHEINAKSYVGTGFLDEVAELYFDEENEDESSIDYVIVNDEISASQNRNIENRFDVKVIDRTQVILDIFSQRAQSKVGQLQVELAQLEYLVPRLKGQGINLSRLGAGIGTRGPGESKLETDRRHINTRIKEIRAQLKVIEDHRERYRARRTITDVVKLSLVGYTNAGKSTLFNLLAKSETYEKDELFATLDPKTQQLVFPNGFQAIISDTVGFIQNLPTTLIESFKSTLEEAKDSEFLIHVVDNSAPNSYHHYETVGALLKQLNMQDIPQIVLFNKADIDDTHHFIPDYPHMYVHKNMSGHDVREALLSLMIKQMKKYEFVLNVQEQDHLYRLKRHTVVMEQELDDDGNYHIKGYEPHGNWINRILNR
ncbi:GTP-binding protein HflX [Aliicoccus persicus]|uniref:GTPase HflX n=1 Tax=Aliicoccus persicus TaxID=930138 RepID=A0A662Z1Y4_9STAP|nr:GTP-binding protein HflX [Aliicoccus persicus]